MSAPAMDPCGEMFLDSIAGDDGSTPMEGTDRFCEIRLNACSLELGAIVALAHDLAADTPSAGMLEKALEHAVRLFGFEAGLLWTLDARSARLRFAGACSLPSAVLAAMPLEIEHGLGAHGHVLDLREPIVMPAAAWSEPPALAPTFRAARIRTLLVIPLLAHGQMMGVMVLTTSRHLDGDVPKKELAAALGTVVGVALLHAVEHAALIQEERLAALGRMAAGVTHELRNPLTVLLARTKLLRMRAETGFSLPAREIIHSVEALDEAAERMKRIVESLSLYSKPPKPERQPLDVAPLLMAIPEILDFSARKGRVTLRVDLPGPGDLRLLGDRSYLLQVLVNLVTNAIEAMGRGGIVTLSAHGTESEVIVEVADTGPGIPHDLQSRIWEPFFTTKAEGTGLGLAIVRSLVSEMNGTIQLDSTPGMGTRFRLCLPRTTRA
ncbi:MAG: HAMP domain-containing histidine kinase [Candidatus Rokubacteria bacterium]|nr:HAMP domain-containing histidine kinase [Candidatus Rokubacteria bacterium]